MKVSLPVATTALLAVLALAGCRGGDPDQAPPIGRAGTTSTADAPLAGVATPDAAATAAVVPVAAPRDRGSDSADAVRSYRDAAAAARATLDTAWNRCGALADADARRCRDAAVLDYDAAIGEARALRGEDGEPAVLDEPAAGVLDRTTDLAMLQVTGTRG